MRTELLKAVSASGEQAAVSASVVSGPGAEPQTVWLPESAAEPAFLIYSITKTFIAALALQLSEEGRLGLDVPVSRWFPRVDRADRFSVRQLLNHTAGVPDYGGLPAYHHGVRAAPSRPWSFERFAAETFDKGLWFEPGTGWAYSNPGYMLVTRILERTADASFHDLVEERFVRPLGLARTFVPLSVEDLTSLAPAMSSVLSPDSTPRDVRQHYHPAWVVHGVVASTSSDVVRVFDRLFAGELLSRHAVDQMTMLVDVPVEAPPHVGRPGYGLGLMGDAASPREGFLGHNGAGPGYRASVFHAPGLGGASVCVMAAVEDLAVEDLVVGGLRQLARR